MAFIYNNVDLYDIEYNNTDLEYVMYQNTYVWGRPLSLTNRRTDGQASTFRIEKIGNPVGTNFQYCSETSGGWIDLPIGTTFSVAYGKSCWIRGNNPNGVSNSDSDFVHFLCNGSFAVSGNIMTLIDGIGAPNLAVPSVYCFYMLFANNTAINNIENLILPANNLTMRCYQKMFANAGGGDTSIAGKTPRIDASVIPGAACEAMFLDCACINEIGDLPATEVQNWGYHKMFSWSGSRTDVGPQFYNVPNFVAKVLGQEAYSYMFQGCKTVRWTGVNNTTTFSYKRMPITGSISSLGTSALLGMFNNIGTNFEGSGGGTPELNTQYFVQGAPLPNFYNLSTGQFTKATRIRFAHYSTSGSWIAVIDRQPTSDDFTSSTACRNHYANKFYNRKTMGTAVDCAFTEINDISAGYGKITDLSKKYWVAHFSPGTNYTMLEYIPIVIENSDVSIPSTYQKVEYLESSGTQIIDTKVTEDFNLLINAQRVDNFSNAAYMGKSEIGGYYLRAAAPNSSGQSFLSVSGDSLGTSEFDIKTRTTFTMAQPKKNNGYTSMNLSAYFYGVTTLSTKNETDYGKSFCLFGIPGMSVGHVGNWRIYEAWFVGKARLIPCKRKSDNKPGMYDTINRRFLTNIGTGEFTCGPNV